MVELLIIAAYLTTVVLIFIDGHLVAKLHESCKDISEGNIWIYILGMAFTVTIGTLTVLVWPVIMIGIKLDNYRNRH